MALGNVSVGCGASRVISVAFVVSHAEVVVEVCALDTVVR